MIGEILKSEIFMIMYAIRLSHDNLIHVWMVITRLRRGRIYRRTLKSRALPSIPMAVSLGKEWLAKCTKALLKEVPHLCKAVRKPTRLGAGRERACAGVRCGACGAGHMRPALGHVVPSDPVREHGTRRDGLWGNSQRGSRETWKFQCDSGSVLYTL